MSLHNSQQIFGMNIFCVPLVRTSFNAKSEIENASNLNTYRCLVKKVSLYFETY